MESDHSQESFPDFRFIPRTLQDIAASKYAFISLCNPSDLLHILPTSIRSMIKDKIRSISIEIRIWNFVVGDIVPREVLINCVAFNSAGGICSRRTVKNLLTSNLQRIDLEKQFQIACSLCIEECIEHLWPSVKDDERFRKCHFTCTTNIFDDGFPHVDLMNYWCSRMRGELKKVYGPEEKSPEWYTVSYILYKEASNVRNWSLIEYFWSNLNNEEKSSLVDEIWIKSSKCFHEDELFHQLQRDPTKNSSRLIIMYSNDCTVVRNFVRSNWFLFIAHFAVDDVYCQYALQLWNYGKSSIVDGATFSYEILFPLSKVAYQYEHSRYAAVLLKEIWLSAPDHLKNHVTLKSNKSYEE
ncbi:uncharacterized protein LOC135844991 [Planococcus citri]|uniref:uncharacterized protein LOC135844991 n=1 Tax=Planococcus citri TaxID=170843 RepID=UPI0031F7613F